MPAKIAETTEPDRALAERLHALIKASAPASYALTELAAADEERIAALVKKAVS